MAVLSYLDLISEIGAEKPDPATINMEHGEIYLIPEECWAAYFQGLGRDTSFSMPRKMLLEMAKLYEEGTMQRGHFYTENKMPKKAQKYERIIGMRSNVARIGLMGTRFRGVHGEPPDTYPLHLRTYGTAIETPTYSISQIVLMEKGTKPLTAKQIRQALDNGDVRVESTNLQVNDNDMQGFIDLPWGQKGFTRYKGGTLTPKCDAREFFEPCEGNGEMQIKVGCFYLGSTAKIYVGPKHMGLLIGVSDPKKTLVHMNAPIVQPYTYSEQTMEIYAKQNARINRGEPSCKLVLYELTQPVPKGLKGTYGGEYYNQQPDGPVASGMHMWTIPGAK